MATETFSRFEFESNVINRVSINFEREERYNEYVYRYDIDTFREPISLVVNSTVDTRDDEVRPKDSDSIKIRFLDEWGNVVLLDGERYSHITREPGWDERCRDRINELLGGKTRIRMCEECGRPMVHRGDFAGCTGWDPDDPDCENTSDI